MTRYNMWWLMALASSVVLGSAVLTAEKTGTKAPPPGAKVLFDGKDLSGWVGSDGKPARWKVQDGYVEVVPRTGDIRTKEKFGPDFQLHVEFWLPLMPQAKGQGRANSGIYLQGRYEVQVLDSYHNDTYANGSVGALYGIIAPDKEAQQKALRPPEQWQTFDITFHAPQVDVNRKVVQKGRLTVVLNGVPIIRDGEFDHPTAGGEAGRLEEPGPIRLQDHGCRVRYRNIWLLPLPPDDRCSMRRARPSYASQHLATSIASRR